MGTFQLVSPAGERIDIGSKKGVALIAMLAMAANGERTRAWLQEKLWGDRSLAQAQNSLRREVANLKKRLGRDADKLFVFGRERIRLELANVHVDARHVAEAVALHEAEIGQPSIEFLEGLDISGEDGFEEWLREQRRAAAERQVAAHARRNDGAPLAAQGFSGRPALAVMPFENLTGDPGQDYVAEGLSEELIDRLSRLRWLPVISRSSSFAAAAGSRVALGGLGAKYLLEGRLSRLEGDYFLSPKLSDAQSEHVLWSQRIKLPSPCSPDVLEQIVAEVVSALDIRIDIAEQSQARTKPKGDLTVDDLIWRGRWHLNRFTRADGEFATKFFAEALALDPDSPEALIQSTFCLAWSLWAERGSEKEILDMRKLAQRAIAADSDDGRAHMLAGIAEMWLRRPMRARASLQQAITLNPSLAMAHAQLGGSYNLTAEPAEAIAPLKTALRLSPNDQEAAFYVLGELAMANCQLGHWSEAIDFADRALVRRPAYWYAHVIKIDALTRSGNRRGAALALRELLGAKPNFTTKYIEWLPFADRALFDRFIKSVASASEPVREGDPTA